MQFHTYVNIYRRFFPKFHLIVTESPNYSCSALYLQ